MKKIKWILPLCIASVMLAGCPYGSNVPIDKPDVKVHKDLLGKWEPKEGGDEVYTITKADEHTYKIENTGGMGKDKNVYTGYLSEVHGTVYLNLMGLGNENNDDKKYYFYKVELNSTNTRMVLRPVSDYITETFTSSEEMREFFKKYQSLSFFFARDTAVLFKD